MPKLSVFPNTTSFFAKLVVIIVGLFLISSVIFTTFQNYETNSIKTTASQKYDFYAKYNTDLVLGADYFQNFIKTDSALTKVRIDTLPNHSTLKLQGIQVVEGQEINTSELNNLVLHPYVDEYETYTWSGYDGTTYLPAISMKVGVGISFDPEMANIIRTIPINTTLAFTQADFTNNFTEASPSNGPLQSITVLSLPTNGTLKRGTTNVGINEVILTSNLGTLNFVPDNNFAGNTTFTIQATDGVLLAAVSNVTIVVGECSGSNTTTNLGSSSAISYSSICITGGAITVYPGDTNANNDICSNLDITYTTDNPTIPVIQEGITCNSTENSIFLGEVETASIRQHPFTSVSDVIFEDLRGVASSNYTVTAEVSNFVDNANPLNTIALGTNPDGASATLDTGIITSVTLVDGGAGYTNTPTIAFTGGGGTGATAVAQVSGGVITRIDMKSYGTGYTTEPTLVIVPNGGGSGGDAFANIIAENSNLNPQTSNPEANIFAELDPSIGTISQLKPSLLISPSQFDVGPRSLITSPTTQYTLFSTNSAAAPGRYKLDDLIFGLRVPAYLNAGDYRSVITQTIVVS
jgi:hypothetical protein